MRYTQCFRSSSRAEIAIKRVNPIVRVSSQFVVPLLCVLPGIARGLDGVGYVPKLLRCVLLNDQRDRIMLVTTVLTIVPCIVVILCYSRVILYVVVSTCRMKIQTARRELRITAVFGAIFLVVVGGFTPYSVVRSTHSFIHSFIICRTRSYVASIVAMNSTPMSTLLSASATAWPLAPLRLVLCYFHHVALRPEFEREEPSNRILIPSFQSSNRMAEVSRNGVAMHLLVQCIPFCVISSFRHLECHKIVLISSFQLSKGGQKLYTERCGHLLKSSYLRRAQHPDTTGMCGRFDRPHDAGL